MAATSDMPLVTSALQSPLHHHPHSITHNLINNSLAVDADIDSYINFEQAASYLSPSPSSSSSPGSLQRHHQHQHQQQHQQHKTTLPQQLTSQPLAHSNSQSSSSFSSTPSQSHQLHHSQQVLYSAPSHQYDSYKQQTGLPMGGLADTMALNGPMGTMAAYSGLGAGATFAYPTTADPMLPMSRPAIASPAAGTTPSAAPGSVVGAGQMLDYNNIPPTRFPQALPIGESDMDINGLDGMQGVTFSPQNSVKAEFVDPNALGGHELSPVVGPPAPVGRVYPGIHQQQAARAKAAQQMRQQQELLRRQQQQQQQQQAQSQQQPHQPQAPQQQQQQQQQSQQAQKLPEQQQIQSDVARQLHRSQGKGRPTDPVVEERISRLLQQMRQSSTASAESSHTPAPALPHVPKQRKEEDDMDDDERLLASEEGKKLSSKERRQLRNKVSARAFRSRRKEYIGQLEGEVTAKTNEASDLKLQNRALMEENARLTDLTRMLLSSPHFASFLNDISVNGLAAPSPGQPAVPQAQQLPAGQDVQMQTPPTNTLASIPEQQQQQPQQQQQQQQPQQQQQNFDFATTPLDVNGPGWNSGIDMNFTTNASIFAVLEVPEGPSMSEINSSALSGKEPFSVLPLPSINAKADIPLIELPRSTVEEAVQPEPQQVNIDANDPAFALFADQQPTPSQSPTPSSSTTILRDVCPKLGLLIVDDNEASSVRRFEQFCARLEGTYQRICHFTSHLD